MKNLKKMGIMLLAFTAFIITSCKNEATGSYLGGNTKPLDITVASTENLKIFSNKTSRTIIADAFDAQSGLTFYIWGKAQSGQDLDPKAVTVTADEDNDKLGKVTLDIDCYNWELTMAACEGAVADLTIENIKEKAVLIGYSNVDMMFTNKIKFTLTPKGLSNPGSVNLIIKTEKDADHPERNMVIPDGYVTKAYIYDIITGEEIKGTDDSSLVQTLADITADAGESYTANGTTILPGTYRFQIELTKAEENRKYVWNDTIVILPGKEIERTVTIPNLIGTKPNAPKDLVVKFNEDNAGNRIDEESKFPGSYLVHLNWDGSDVTTEMNFALQIAELADDYELPDEVAQNDNQAVFEDVWNNDGNAKAKYTFDYLNDIRNDTRFFYDGSLFANNTDITLTLELGKRYVMRLYSENNAGYSNDAAYATITPDSKDTGVSKLRTINRFRVKYYTQGGKWLTVKDGTATDGNDKIKYWSQSDKAYAVIDPAANGENPSEAAPTLVNEPAKWNYWITDLSNSTKYPTTGNPAVPDAYAGFKNLDLYAIYSREGDVEFHDDTTYELTEYVTGFGITKPLQNAMNTFSKGSNTNTTLTVTLPSDDASIIWVYDKVSFQITYAGKTFFNEEQDGAARGTANTFTIPLQNLPTGYVYNCLVTAQYQKTFVSYPFVVYITD